MRQVYDSCSRTLSGKSNFLGFFQCPYLAVCKRKKSANVYFSCPCHFSIGCIQLIRTIFPPPPIFQSGAYSGYGQYSQYSPPPPSDKIPPAHFCMRKIQGGGGDYVLVVKFSGGIMATYTKKSRGFFVRGGFCPTLAYSITLDYAPVPYGVRRFSVMQCQIALGGGMYFTFV